MSKDELGNELIVRTAGCGQDAPIIMSTSIFCEGTGRRIIPNRSRISFAPDGEPPQSFAFHPKWAISKVFVIANAGQVLN